jgi:hypothetical protein
LKYSSSVLVRNNFSKGETASNNDDNETATPQHAAPSEFFSSYVPNKGTHVFS